MKTYSYTIKVHPADPDAGGYWVAGPALPGCVTQGETCRQAIAMAHEAIEGYLEALAKRGEPIPEESRSEDEITATLHVRQPHTV